MTYDEIMREITAGLTGDFKRDVAYLDQKRDEYAQSPLGGQIADTCGKMIYDLMPREEKLKLHEKCIKERAKLRTAMEKFYLRLLKEATPAALDLMRPWWRKEIVLAQCAIFPDEKRCRFLKTIEVVGVSSIPNRREVLSLISKDERVRFVREKNRKYAIRIEKSFISGDKLGYVPRDDAREWALAMDKGRTYAGWIRFIDKKESRILLDVYEHIPFSLGNISDILFQSGGFITPHLALKIFIPERLLIYQKQIQPWSRTIQQIMLTFDAIQWNEFALPALMACNFLGWHDKYYALVCDGMQWKMQITQGDRGVMQIYGSNDFPEEWNIFQQFINDCLTLKTLKSCRTSAVIDSSVPGAERQLFDLPRDL